MDAATSVTGGLTFDALRDGAPWISPRDAWGRSALQPRHQDSVRRVCVAAPSERMDQRNYGIPAGRGGLPGGMPQQPPQQQQQRAPQPGMQQHYGMQDMMFDPLPMSNGMFHQPPAVGGHMMHQQHPGVRGGGMQSLGGLMPQQGMVAPEDDLDDLMSALGDPVGMTAQQQQPMGQMPNHVYDQSHLVPPRSQAPSLQPGRAQGLPLPSQVPSMQQGIPGSMHMNQMPPNAGSRMGVGLQQQGMGAPPASSSIGGLGGLGAAISAPTAPRQAAVSPSAIVPTSTKSSTSSRALATSSNNGGSSDEDAGMGEDDAQKKKERRRQQVRYASPVFADGGHERASADGGVREADADGADAAQGQQQAEGAVAAARELRSHDPVRSERAAE
ncbi:unnamed protein product [Phytophthora fragariaefolia]|uniref:Unnamed protein product n=1 Tax=Phytophthora fragariaefolia TaxID=1490495 RepID=A0A9W6XZC1_9STRA|nr:unnamed protein product [Phytophthora fragariaefolia]